MTTLIIANALVTIFPVTIRPMGALLGIEVFLALSVFRRPWGELQHRSDELAAARALREELHV